mgnify:CR=1 FL=1
MVLSCLKSKEVVEIKDQELVVQSGTEPLLMLCYRNLQMVILKNNEQLLANFACWQKEMQIIESVLLRLEQYRYSLNY